MKLRLKEDPREWRKFGLSSSLVLALLVGLLWWRGKVSSAEAVPALSWLALVALLAGVRPGWFRTPYRVGMRVSHFLGRIVSPLILGLVFFLVVTPLGLVMRLLGKDLLRLRRNPTSATYWQPARSHGDLTKMF